MFEKNKKKPKTVFRICLSVLDIAWVSPRHSCQSANVSDTQCQIPNSNQFLPSAMLETKKNLT